MVNTALPEDLRSMEGRCYIHDAKQLRWAILGVENARKAEDAGTSMLQSGHVSEILSEDGKWKIDYGSCNTISRSQDIATAMLATDNNHIKHSCIAAAEGQYDGAYLAPSIDR